MNKTNMIKGYIFIIASGVIFGCMPLMTKHIYAGGVNSLTLVLLRNILALPFMAMIVKGGGGSLRIPKRAIPSIGLIALLGCSVTPILLLSSYNYIASGTATIFHFIYPAAVAAAEIIFLRKRTKAASIISLMMCIIGICMFYTPGEALDPIGSLLALSSGLTYAAYIILLSFFRHKEISGFLLNFHISLISTVIMTAACLISGQLTLPATLGGWLLCILFALAINVCGVVLFQRGTFIIGGQRASILSTFEPITSIFVGAMFLGEELIFRSLLGAALVIAAGVIIALSDMKGTSSAE